MQIKAAKAVAQQWVLDQLQAMPGFAGAFFHGSTNWLPDDALLPPTSDLDVMVVHTEPNPAGRRGKFVYRDVLLEVSYLPQQQLQSPEQVLSNYQLAGSFKAPGIIADPSGALTTLQAAVGREYAKRVWVRKRCEHARNNVLRTNVVSTAPLYEQVLAWSFPAGISTHILLVAGLKNPTVRQRYVAVRELLEEYGQLEFYTPLLELLGCANMRPAQVEQHLDALGVLFDAASAVIKTPFPFAADISALARPVAIDGSRALIARGLHREAIFWMIATACRCQQVLAHDAPVALQERFRPAFAELLADLGISSFADLQRRRDAVTALLPQVWAVAEAILAANPGIEDLE